MTKILWLAWVIFCIGCEAPPPEANARPTRPLHQAARPFEPEITVPKKTPVLLEPCKGPSCDGVWLINDTSCPVAKDILEARQVAFGGDERPLIGLIDLAELPKTIAFQLPTGFSPMNYVARDGVVIDFQWSGFSNTNKDGLDDNIRKIRNLLVRTNVVNGDPTSFQKKWVGDFELEAFSDYSAMDLSGQNLSNLRLPKVNFSGSNLSHANLAGSDLSGAFLFHTDLTGAKTNGTDFTGASFRQTICPNGELTDTSCDP